MLIGTLFFIGLFFYIDLIESFFKHYFWKNAPLDFILTVIARSTRGIGIPVDFALYSRYEDGSHSKHTRAE